MADPGILLADVRVVVTEVNVADHARKQIRDAAVAALTTDLVPGTVLGIYPGRVHPFEDGDLPAISVFTAAEQVDPSLNVMGGGGQFRRLELLLEIRAKVGTTASPDLLSVLDNIALEAERSLEGSATLSGLLQDLEVERTGTELVGEDTEKPVGLMTIQWTALYRVDPADPAVIA